MNQEALRNLAVKTARPRQGSSCLYKTIFGRPTVRNFEVIKGASKTWRKGVGASRYRSRHSQTSSHHLRFLIAFISAETGGSRC